MSILRPTAALFLLALTAGEAAAGDTIAGYTLGAIPDQIVVCGTVSTFRVAPPAEMTGASMSFAGEPSPNQTALHAAATFDPSSGVFRYDASACAAREDGGEAVWTASFHAREGERDLAQSVSFTVVPFPTPAARWALPPGQFAASQGEPFLTRERIEEGARTIYRVTMSARQLILDEGTLHTVLELRPVDQLILVAETLKISRLVQLPDTRLEIYARRLDLSAATPAQALLLDLRGGRSTGRLRVHAGAIVGSQQALQASSAVEVDTAWPHVDLFADRVYDTRDALGRVGRPPETVGLDLPPNDASAANPEIARLRLELRALRARSLDGFDYDGMVRGWVPLYGWEPAGDPGETLARSVQMYVLARWFEAKARRGETPASALSLLERRIADVARRNGERLDATAERLRQLSAAAAALTAAVADLGARLRAQASRDACAVCAAATLQLADLVRFHVRREFPAGEPGARAIRVAEPGGELVRGSGDSLARALAALPDDPATATPALLLSAETVRDDAISYERAVYLIARLVAAAPSVEPAALAVKAMLQRRERFTRDYLAGIDAAVDAATQAAAIAADRDALQRPADVRAVHRALRSIRQRSFDELLALHDLIARLWSYRWLRAYPGGSPLARFQSLTERVLRQNGAWPPRAAAVGDLTAQAGAELAGELDTVLRAERDQPQPQSIYREIELSAAETRFLSEGGTLYIDPGERDWVWFTHDQAQITSVRIADADAQLELEVQPLDTTLVQSHGVEFLAILATPHSDMPILSTRFDPATGRASEAAAPPAGAALRRAFGRLAPKRPPASAEVALDFRPSARALLRVARPTPLGPPVRRVRLGMTYSAYTDEYGRRHGRSTHDLFAANVDMYWLTRIESDPGRSPYLSCEPGDLLGTRAGTNGFLLVYGVSWNRSLSCTAPRSYGALRFAGWLDWRGAPLGDAPQIHVGVPSSLTIRAHYDLPQAQTLPAPSTASE